MDIISALIINPAIALVTQTKTELLKYILLRAQLRIIYKYPFYLAISIAITSILFLLYYLYSQLYKNNL